MSQLFISYSHKDKDIHKKFIDFLKNNGFTDNDIWHDENILPGEDWKEAIDNGLAESFALVLLITPNSMQSQYCTYEWSAFLGNGGQIIPLLFEGNDNNIHKRLQKTQYLDCKKGIPDNLIETINAYRATFAEVEYLNMLILWGLAKWRVLAYTTLWFFDHIKHPPDNSDFQSLVSGMLDETREARTKLVELIVEKKYAFTKKQLIATRNLIQKLGDFWNIFYSPNSIGNVYRLPVPAQSVTPDAINYFNENIQPLLSFFHIKHSQEEAMVSFQSYLSGLSESKITQPHKILRPTQIVEWAFQNDKKYWELIDRIVNKVTQRVENKK